MPRKSPKTLVRHDRKFMFKLTEYVSNFYAASKKSDADFAEQAQTHFETPITKYTIAACRDLLDLESNTARAQPKNGPLLARIAALEVDVETLRRRLDVLTSGCRGDKPVRPSGLNIAA